MARHRSRLSLCLIAACLAPLLVACPDIPAPPVTWADEDTWVDPYAEDTESDAYPDGIVPLSLERIFASTDESTGGARVTIVGTGFEQGMEVHFGEVAGNYVLAIDGERLNVDVPPHEPGLVDVSVSRPDGMIATLKDAFLYRSPLVLEDIDLNQGLISGGEEVILRGDFFDENTRILIGGRQLINAEVVDATSIKGEVPARLKGWHGIVDVVASDGFEQRTLKGAYTYRDTLEINWISPNSGSIEGGDYVTLYGTGLTKDTVVRVGGIVAETYSAGRGDLLTFRVPPGDAGVVDIQLQDPLQSHEIARSFVYLDPSESENPALISAWPDRADKAGGTQVALTVSALPLSATRDNLAVRVNGQSASVLEVRVSEHLVVVSVPEGDTGIATVEITHEDFVLTSESVLNYHAGLHIDPLEPFIVKPNTHTLAIFTGRGFDEDTEVLVEGTLQAPITLSATSMSVMLPPSSPGRADIVVRSGEIQKRIVAGVHCVEEARSRVLAISSADSARSGGRLMRLYGEGFSSLQAPPLIAIEGSPVDNVELIDDAEIRFRAPPGDIGTISVDAKDLGLIAMGHERFNPTLSYGGAWGGPIREALNVSVLDMFTGAPIEDAFVTLWDDTSTPYQGRTDERGELTLSGPKMGAPQMVSASKMLYTSASIVEFDARNATLLLIPLTSAPPSPGGPGGLGPVDLPDGTLSGEVVTIDKFMLPPPGECEPKLSTGVIASQSDLCRGCESDADCEDEGARCVNLGEEGFRCTTPCSTEDDCPSGFMCAGIGGGAVQCLPKPGDKSVWCGTTIEDVFSRDMTQFGSFSTDPTTYTFDASPGEHAVVCLGGFTNPDTGVFKPVLMGVRRHVFAMPGDFVGQQDLVLDIPLNRSLRMRLDDPPSGSGAMNQHRIDVFIDLGPDGVFPMPQQVIGEDIVDTIELPGFPAAFEESLYDASYSIYAQALLPETLSGTSGTGSYTLHTDIRAVHDDAVFEIFDAGARVTSSGITQDIRAMDGAGDSWAWAVGDAGKILAWDGTWWGLQQAPTKETLHALYVRSTVDVWAAGERGALVHWDGLIWRDVEVPEELANANWRAIKGHEEGALWLAGDKGAWQVRDGEWSALDLGQGADSQSVNAIWVAGPEEIWFVGQGGLIRQLLNGESKILDVPGADLHSVEGAEGEVWAVGKRGRMLRYTNGVWFDYIPLTLRDLHALHVTGEGEVWAVGDAGSVLQWEGERWREHSGIEHVDLRGVHVSAEERVLVGGVHVLVIGPFLRAPIPTNPAENATMDGLNLAWSLEESHPASFTYLQLTEGQGFPFWILMVEGERNEVPLPDFFEMQGLMAIWPGPGFMRFVRVYAPDFDINNHDNTVLSQFYWRSWVLHDVPVIWGPSEPEMPNFGGAF